MRVNGKLDFWEQEAVLPAVGLRAGVPIISTLPTRGADRGSQAQRTAPVSPKVRSWRVAVFLSRLQQPENRSWRQAGGGSGPLVESGFDSL